MLQFLVSPENDDAHPLTFIHNLIQFDADQRIRTHPLDFLAWRRKAIEIGVFVHKIDGNDVGLILMRTRQPARSGASNGIEAFSLRYLLD